MNADKFVSDKSHHHNTSLHAYLHMPSSSSNSYSHPSSSSLSPSSTVNLSTEHRTSNNSSSQDTPVIHDINTAASLEDNDGQKLNSVPNQTKQETIVNTNRNTLQSVSNKTPITKMDSNESKGNLKRKSVDIKSYFISTGMFIHTYNRIRPMFTS